MQQAHRTQISVLCEENIMFFQMQKGDIYHQKMCTVAGCGEACLEG
jgi:hypothetical protein